jgi:type VI protein secretion system component VasK
MTDARLQQDRAVLNARYEADVAQTWHKAIGQLTLKSPASLQALALWLKSLSRDGASFTVVLQQVLKNTKGVNTAQFKALQSTLDNRDYQDELGHVLSGLSSYVGDVASGLAPNEKALAATQKMAVKMPDVFVEAKALIAKSPWPLKGWVQSIVSNTHTQLYGAAKLAFMQRYHNNWANSCHRLLGSGKASAVGITPHFSVVQFSQFFAPGAVADQFDKNQAAPFMADNLIGLASTVIDNLQKARQVKATYFKGGKNPDVIFNVGPRYLSKNIAKFTLTVDGKSMMYENGPQVKNVLHWQGKGDHHVKLSFEALDGQTYTQTFSGPWAVITLFNSAKTTKLKDGNYDVAWTLDGYTAHYQVNVKGADFAGVVALKDIAC